MTSYNAPLRDMQFILKEMLEIQTYQDLPGFEEVTEDLIDAVEQFHDVTTLVCRSGLKNFTIIVQVADCSDVEV